MWVNGNHTTTSTSVPLGAGPWDSPINQNTMSYTYVVNAAGTYDYQCSFHYMMGMVGHFTANEASGIGENIAGVQLDVYANPATRNIQIHLNTTRSGQMNINLSDITGREVRQLASGDQSAGEHHLDYSVAGLPKGVYLLKFTFNNDDLIRKIIIQ
jgi:hypothetical protein